MSKKAKSKDNLASSSGSKRSGFTTPRTDTDFKLTVGVDEIPDLDDAPLKFVYGKDLLPDTKGLSSFYAEASLLEQEGMYTWP